eukprot:3613079-Amphidinium_carterae.1
MVENEPCRHEDEVGTSSLSASMEGLAPSLTVEAVASLTPSTSALSCHMVASGNTAIGTPDISTGSACTVADICHTVASGKADTDIETPDISTRGACVVADGCHTVASGNTDSEIPDTSTGSVCAVAEVCHTVASGNIDIETPDISTGSACVVAHVCHTVASGNIDNETPHISTGSACATVADVCHMAAPGNTVKGPSLDCYEIDGLELDDMMGALNPLYVGQDIITRVDDTLIPMCTVWGAQGHLQAPDCVATTNSLPAVLFRKVSRCLL